MTDPLFIVVDLFCGAGGTTTGFALAELEGKGIAKVIACVNHDPLAIKSHWANHPEVKHFNEDIRTLDLTELIALVKYYRKKYPNAYLILWASLECTNFSKAKGGQPRDADSRTLADHLERYILRLNPDYIQIENVVEFMSWGPLDDNGKPISRKNGEDWMRWRKTLCLHGYTDEWKELNSANFGAYTSRNRLFGVFAKDGLPIAWPESTHGKVKKGNATDLFSSNLQPWKAVKDVLNFDDEGESIFNRKKPLSDKTLERIYAGLLKYVAKGDTSFISKYYSGKPSGKVNSVESPSSTVTTFGNQSLVQTKFLLQSYAANSKGDNVFPVNNPGRTITTRDSTQLVQPSFLACYYGNGSNVSSIENPSPTIVTKDRIALVKAVPFIMPTNFNNKPTSIEQPSPVITANRKHHYIVQAEIGKVAIVIYEDDSEIMTAIKRFMAAYNIIDIKMRMLRVLELLKIQGFPSGYQLQGNQSDQKKFIGNSVVPQVVKAWTEAMAMKLMDNQNKNVA